jgi:16S rRNA G966 N2-methylase RsmD
VDQNGFIVDGHHRYKAAQSIGIKPEFEIRTFMSRTQELDFIYQKNVVRRHLNEFERIEHYLVTEEKKEKEQARLRQLSKLKDVKNSLSIKNNNVPLASNCANGDGDGRKEKVSEIIAMKAKSYARQVERVQTILKFATEDQLNRLRKGKSTINQEYVKTRRDIKRHEYLEDCKNDSNNNESAINNNCKLILGDFKEAAKNIANNSIGLILTDPPYADTPENLELYKELAQTAEILLKPGNSIVFFVGHIILNKVIRIFDDSGLNYWWTFAVKHSGSHSKIHARHIFTQWKPMLMYVKGDTGPDEFSTSNTIGDFIQSEAPAKILHEWEQSTTEAEYIIRKLTLAPQTVLDPFMGSGTNGVAALQMNRKFIGIEKDSEKFELAKKRISLLSEEVENDDDNK